MVDLWWHPGDGNGDGNGNGDGDGYGNGGGNGDGYGDGYSNGNGDGYGDGYGYGNGYGYGDGYGDGNGDGYGNGGGMVGVSDKTPIMAYWYVGSGNKKHFGQQLTPVVGDVHTWPYEPRLCSHGLHASMTPEDASTFRDGALCRVACSGLVRMDKDKLTCTRREIVEVIR